LQLKRKPLYGCRKSFLPSSPAVNNSFPEQRPFRLGLRWSGQVGGAFVLAVAKEASIYVGGGTLARVCHQGWRLTG
jgi:hypothetical protein